VPPATFFTAEERSKIIDGILMHYNAVAPFWDQRTHELPNKERSRPRAGPGCRSMAACVYRGPSRTLVSSGPQWLLMTC
jgi:hypothetical protein